MKDYNIPKVFNKYKSSVNMNLSDMKKWKSNPCSKKASIGRTAVNRNISLLSKPSKEWSNRDASEANKTISFNARMSKMPDGKHIKGCNLSKRDISLKNWAMNPHKDNSSKNFGKYPYTYETFTIGDMLKKKPNNNLSFLNKFTNEDDNDKPEDIVEDMIGKDITSKNYNYDTNCDYCNKKVNYPNTARLIGDLIICKECQEKKKK